MWSDCSRWHRDFRVRDSSATFTSRREAALAATHRLVGSTRCILETRGCLMAYGVRNRILGAAIAVGLLSCGLLHAQSVALHDGLISYWPLNEGAGATAADMGPAGSVADT